MSDSDRALVHHLEVHDFRSWTHGVLELTSGVHVLVGGNGVGKTNLVEALLRATTGSSPRSATDAPLIRTDATHAVVRVLGHSLGRERSIDLQLARPGSGVKRVIRVDGNDAARSRDALGIFPVVSFMPEDLQLVRGDPSTRRAFLDVLLPQRRPSYAGIKSDFDRVLRQRNALLRGARGLRGPAKDAALVTLKDWTEQFISLSSQLVLARSRAVAMVQGPLTDAYQNLTGRTDPISVNYEDGFDDPIDPDMPLPDVVDRYRDAFQSRGQEERERGTTLFGPHRDDLQLTLHGLPARTHASQGEAWSVALALRIASIELLTEDGQHPLIVLDDVFGELDRARRSALSALAYTWPQVLVTGAVRTDIPVDGVLHEISMDSRASRLVGSHLNVPNSDITAEVRP